MVVAADAALGELRVEYCLPEASLRLSIADNESLERFHWGNCPKYTAIGPRRVKQAIPCYSLRWKWSVWSSCAGHAFRSNIMCMIPARLIELIRPLDRSQWPLLFQELDGLLIGLRSLVRRHKRESDRLLLLLQWLYLLLGMAVKFESLKTR